MIGKFAIKNDELCPCGSGKTYGECCRNRKDAKTPKEDGSDMKEIMKKSFIKVCLHPDSGSCSGPIKTEHMIQSRYVLDLLSRDGKVYMFAANKTMTMEVDEEGNTVPVPVFEKVAADDAVTHGCFCEKHDAEIFEAIEKRPFEPDDEEQTFIMAYRILIFELYNELVVENMYQKTIKDFPSLLRSPNFVKAYRNNKEKISEMQELKKMFEKGIEDRDHTQIRTVVFRVDKSLKFADHALMEPWFDINGKSINGKNSSGMKNIFFSVVPGRDESYVIVSCPEKNMKKYEKLFAQINEKPKEVTEAYFNFYIPLFSQNIVIGPEFWDSMDDNKKKSFLYLTSMTGRDAFDISMGMQNHLRNLRSKKRIHPTNPKSFNFFE